MDSDVVIEDEELSLTDLISVETLQKIQDAFSDMSGVAALTTERTGEAVTNGSNFSDFCMRYTRQTEVGRKRCEQCDRMGAEVALDRGASCAYFCHAKLVDFAAPIMVGGKMIGSFIGGQVLTTAPDEEEIRQVAREIGVDEEDYVEAVKKVRIVEKNQIDKYAQFLYVIAGVLSEIAYAQHRLLLQNIELEKATNTKSDFLANMSHEIRTPMNAITGMADMALREDLPGEAREYVRQIKSSGHALLAIINDILDFSKIESGKMDINEVEYEPMSLINDMINIIETRIGDKNLELTLDINPDLPLELYGDDIRIKQVLINLCNNAVKFTQEGCVHLCIDFDRTDEETILMKVSVQDTGSGIKEEDINKLFHSFQQVDSKRNRNVEGTGLGLAISKQLVSLMNGTMSVKSRYGYGSTFSFNIPQKIIKDQPSIEKCKEKINAAGLIVNEYLTREITRDMPRLGAQYTDIRSEEELDKLPIMGVKYLFVEQHLLTETVREFLFAHSEITGVILVNFKASHNYKIPNVRVITKPLYVLNLAGVLHGEEYLKKFKQMSGDEEDDGMDFIAPEAEVLIVDDNQINLTVAEGLLEPLQMKIDTATSGKEAVDKISAKLYDVVFMDHMMPEMDGVETTRVVRRMLGTNGKIPIIALTANAVDGTREMFVSEGMDDFVPKPIELKVISAALRRWLPAEKVIPQDKDQMEAKKKEKEERSSGEELHIEGLHVGKAMQLLGNEDLFWSVLKEYYRVIDKKTAMIRAYEQEEKLKEYTVEVHALKSASRQIGALELADTAEQMESAGNAGDKKLIHEVTPGMLEKYQSYKPILEPYFAPKSENKDAKPATAEQIADFFVKLREAMDNLDMDAMEEVTGQMDGYTYEESAADCFARLKDAVEDIDTEKCEEIIQEWEGLIA